jgi:hypothetical protein
MTYEYLAGLFDGEGSVSIRKQQSPKSSLPTYGIQCTINMTCAKTIQAVRDFLGYGNLYSLKRVGTNRTVSRWTVSHTMAEELLRMIEPYSITKKPEIKLALRFQRHMHKYHYSNNGYKGQKGFHHHPDSVRNARHLFS